MITWTGAGAVAAARALQVRVEARFPERVRAGAPQPSRALTDDELSANVQAFTVGRRGPRDVAVDTLVLSAVGTARAAGVAAQVRAARTLGIERVSLHGSVVVPEVAAGALEGQADDVALRVADEVAADVAVGIAARCPARVHVVVPLSAEVLPILDALAARLAQATVRVLLTWPFPGADEPPPPAPEVAAAALAGPAAALRDAGVTVGVKGLPRCVLDGVEGGAGRTRNRWYVDADHQAPHALRFLPDIVRFRKPDSCRFCAADTTCDGVASRWLDLGLAAGLRPIERA